MPAVKYGYYIYKQPVDRLTGLPYDGFLTLNTNKNNKNSEVIHWACGHDIQDTRNSLRISASLQQISPEEDIAKLKVYATTIYDAARTKAGYTLIEFGVVTCDEDGIRLEEVR